MMCTDVQISSLVKAKMYHKAFSNLFFSLFGSMGHNQWEKADIFFKITCVSFTSKLFAIVRRLINKCF